MNGIKYPRVEDENLLSMKKLWGVNPALGQHNKIIWSRLMRLLCLTPMDAFAGAAPLSMKPKA
jgi:hypothetical protein